MYIKLASTIGHQDSKLFLAVALTMVMRLGLTHIGHLTFLIDVLPVTSAMVRKVSTRHRSLVLYS